MDAASDVALSLAAKTARVSTRMTPRGAFLTAAFVLFLYPVDVGPLSVNYSFLLLPIFIVARDRTVKKPPPIVVAVIGLFTLIFIVASLYQVEFLGDSLRRVSSFVIFMSVFSYLLIEIDATMVCAFKTALVIISLLLSLSTIYQFAILGGSDLGSGAKVLVGSQRIGFVYLMAIWVAYLHARRSAKASGERYGILLVLLAGLLLTFSRASIVGLIGSFGVFAVVRLWEWVRRARLRLVRNALTSIIGIGVMIVALNMLFPTILTFFDERLFTWLFQADVVMARLRDTGTSEGTRVLFAGKILTFVLNNPLTGSGYLGVWTVMGDITGSAHSQYTDVLFRTGLLGFAAYGYIIIRLLRSLSNDDKSLFWGLFGVLIYGVFHETFKESQGAFVLAFLLGMMAQSSRAAQLVRRDPIGRRIQ